MFERYTEKARRVILLRKIRSQPVRLSVYRDGAPAAGLVARDKALTNRFLRSHASVESIRKQIEGHTTIREKVSLPWTCL